MSTQPILVYKIINFSDPIPRNLLNKIQKHRSILRKIKSLLPDSLRKNIIDCAIKDNNLLIFTESSVWASQLRFYNPAILQFLNKQEIPKFQRIKIKILPPQRTPTVSQITHVIPSMETVKHLKRHGTTLADSELKQSLQRLAQSLEKRALISDR